MNNVIKWGPIQKGGINLKSDVVERPPKPTPINPKKKIMWDSTEIYANGAYCKDLAKDLLEWAEKYPDAEVEITNEYYPSFLVCYKREETGEEVGRRERKDDDTRKARKKLYEELKKEFGE